MRCRSGMLGAGRQKGWDISRGTFASSIDLSSDLSGAIKGIEFGDGGFSLYVSESVEVARTGKLFQYSLSTPYSITAASYVRSVEIEYSSSPSGNKQTRQVSAVTLRPDGLAVYVASSSTPKAIQQYDLATPWDISGMSYSRRFTYAEGAGTAVASDVQFSTDGSRMFLANQQINIGKVFSYTLSTPWDISSAASEYELSVNAQQTGVGGLAFRPNGLQMFIIGNLGDKVNEYSLSTAWDITTASHVQEFIQSSDAGPCHVRFRPDGTKMFFRGSFSNSVFEYALA